MPIIQLPHRLPPRRLRAVAIAAAVLLHLAVVLFVPFPIVPRIDDAVTFLVLPDTEAIPPLLLPPDAAFPPEPPAEATTATGGQTGAPGEGAAGVAAAIPFLPRPAGATAAPATRPTAAPATGATAVPAAAGMTEARAATLPLVVRSGGGLGGRRLGRTAEQLAIARAESLLVARLAGIAVVERRETGAVGLANGGVTVAIPWGGFLPADRGDGEWREDRCSGGGDGDSDKAGEGEARRAQCD